MYVCVVLELAWEELLLLGREWSLLRENLCAGGIRGLGAEAVGTGIILEVRRKISLLEFSVKEKE